MRTYKLDREGKEHLYLSLYRQMREEILSGELRTGERLPSKRALAMQLGVSVLTVENAYAQLRAEGYIDSAEKKGYFVADIGELSTVKASSAAANIERLKNDSEIPMKEPVQEAVFADLTGGGVDRTCFPLTVWCRLMRSALTNNRESLLTAPEGQGIKPLRQAIADHLMAFRGTSVDPDCIVIGAGSEYLYGLLIGLLGRNRVYGMEEPGYPQMARVLKANGVLCRHIEMDEKGVSMSELERKRADILHLTPAHHFPTGLVMPVGRRQALLEWAGKAEGRWLIEDEYDSEFRFSGRPIPPLFSADKFGRVIYLNTFTKSLSPAFRIAYMILPLSLMEKFREKLSFLACTVPVAEQITLAHFISEGYFSRHISRMRCAYKEKRDRMRASIRSTLPESSFRIVETDAGLHFLLEVDTPEEDESIVRRASALGIRMNSLAYYYADGASAPVHRFVVDYSSLEKERISETVRRLCIAFFGANR